MYDLAGTDEGIVEVVGAEVVGAYCVYILGATCPVVNVAGVVVGGTGVPGADVAAGVYAFAVVGLAGCSFTCCVCCCCCVVCDCCCWGA